MDISIVIPNYNGAKLLEKNIPRLIKILETYVLDKKKRIEVIIVDDASTDKSKEIIETLLTRFSSGSIVIRPFLKPENHGFSPTVNIGVKEAEGEFIILLNSDAYPEDDFITPALSHFDDEDLFAVGFMDKSIESENIVLRGRGIGKWERGFLVHKRGDITREDTLWVNGGSSIYRKSVWIKLGGLLPVYAPYYWEDIDLSYRAQKNGYKLRFEKDSVVVHEHDEGAIKKTQSKRKVQIIAFRNQILFAWINITDKKLFLSHLVWLPYHIVHTLLLKETTFVLGFLSALGMLSDVIKVRRRVQKHVKKSDAFVTELYTSSL